jgi:hypothetical protein
MESYYNTRECAEMTLQINKGGMLIVIIVLNVHYNKIDLIFLNHYGVL